MGRDHPVFCEHDKAIYGGDFLEDQDCEECDIQRESTAGGQELNHSEVRRAIAEHESFGEWPTMMQRLLGALEATEKERDELSHRIYPGQGHGYENELMRLKNVVVPSLQDAIDAVRSERDLLCEDNKALREELQKYQRIILFPEFSDAPVTDDSEEIERRLKEMRAENPTFPP